MNTTICPVARWAKAPSDRIALKTQSETISYAEWNEQISVCVTALATHGVGEAQRVALCLESHADYLTVLLALFRLGAVACPINPAFPDAYRAVRLKQLDCQHRIVDGRIPVGKSCIFAGTLFEETYPAATESIWELDTPATIIFTSGSTGAPKAAVLSLGNHLSNATTSNANILLTSKDVWLLSLPLYHVAGLGILFRCLKAGATIGIPGTDESLEEATEALGATHFSLVARQLARLLESPQGTHVLSQAKAILLGGSAIPTALLVSAHEHALPIHTTYGMTEMATQITTTPPGADLKTLQSSGRPLLPGAVRIGEFGTIEVNGPTRFLGYWEHGTLHKPFNADGWFTTGDCGHFDDCGNLHIDGRMDNMFVSGGENIQPECIERALGEIDGITQAVVVPVPHPEFGNTLVAFVEDAEHRTLSQIQEALRTILPNYQLPRHLLSWPEKPVDEGMKTNRATLIREAIQQFDNETSPPNTREP